MSAEERKTWIAEAGKQRVTLSFYQYAKIKNTQVFRDHLFLAWDALEVLGRTYVATEGINAQISLPADNLEEFREHLNTISFLNGIRLNVAVEQDDNSFLKLKIKIRNKIVADGLDDHTIDLSNGGEHVGAMKFNELIEDPNTVLVDMRNHYESEVGHFKNALTPDVDTFRESLPIIAEDLKAAKQNKKLVMYCTGGIRCEKASAYFKQQGFNEVYQLEGGVIEYTRQVKAYGLDNKFKGVNFVFDNRLAERITEDVIAKCHQCGESCDTHTNCANIGCNMLFIQCEKCAKQMEGACSEKCQEIIKLPYEQQKALRKGKPAGNKKYKKGRWE